MKKRNKMIVIAITVLAILIIAVFAGQLIYKNMKTTSVIDNKSPGAIDLTGYTNTDDITIRSASYLYTPDGEIEGYLVKTASRGHNGIIQMDITFDNTGNLIKSVLITDHTETDGSGDKITDTAFLNQFNNITAPIILSGTQNNTGNSGKQTQTANEDENGKTRTADNESMENTDSESDGIQWTDGTFEAEESDFDDQGYKDKVTIKIQNGKMMDVIWDAYNADGELKSVLSADGIYEMPGSSLTWQEQAMAITDYLIKNQSADGITMNNEGETDAVTGVTISVRDFVALVKECLEKAAVKPEESASDTLNTQSTDITDTANTAGIPADTASKKQSEDTGNASSTIDAISGATVSSAAVVDGVNKSWSFLQDFVLKK